MMLLGQKLKNFGSTLSSNLSVPVYHYWRSNVKETRFVIWAEDSEKTSFDADNKKQNQQIEITVDFFSKEEFDEEIENIQNVLDSIDNIGWSLNSVQYEDSTKLIHHEWLVRII